MPFLYESRQHKRTARESLDCALALQELVEMGVENILTFEAHDPRVQNAIPLHGFETIPSAYQMVKGLLKNVEGLKLDSEHIRYVMDCLDKNTTLIGNIRAYTLSALFNAPVTISQYYASLVSHDMAVGFGGG